jgi:hypothetical protein
MSRSGCYTISPNQRQLVGRRRQPGHGSPARSGPFSLIWRESFELSGKLAREGRHPHGAVAYGMYLSAGDSIDIET